MFHAVLDQLEVVPVKMNCFTRRGAALVLTGICVVAGGCSARHYRKSADKEVAAAIAGKTPKVPNMDPAFTIEQTNGVSLAGLPQLTEPSPELGKEAESEVGAHVLTLEKALEIAVQHSRTYQSNKEQVYLQALSLTLARHRFTPIFSTRLRPDYQVTTESVAVGIDALTGEPTSLAGVGAALVEEHRITGEGSAGVSALLRSGARISSAFTTDFLRYLTGSPRTFTSSELSATLIQPLWQGGGYRATVESLTQAERDLLYRLRDFTQFRKDFSVQIATAYYNVLQARDAVRNNYLGFQNFKRNVLRGRALAEEGLLTQASLGQLEQAELSTETTWINAIRSYKQRLDNFKLQLGLPYEANIVMDESELKELKLIHPNMEVDDAIKVALGVRLDLQNVRERYDDAGRQVELAKNGLRPQVDLVASAGINSRAETGTGFPLPDPNRYRWNAGLDVELPFDRKSERNNYRAALIAQQQAARQLEQRVDEIKLQIRENWRNLDQAKRNYEIGEIGIELSERRVEEQELRAEVGRGQARDLVDAQNALIAQKNQRTQALVSHTIARLQFWNDMGILFIKEKGQWEVKNGE
ncbi:MAG: TolC family protein [Verrucomicrobiota bacterium]